ncbi:hypothetical protein WH297_19230 [Ochrobactrum vermis]|uniref:Histidine kinase n=1 Tax=Ochrobactrum vermis TaxID=1827297 RepID=A0ABU8PJM5_9HYPH|nr:hypothetical protein [Ochrobactrum vermis]PQZ26161.1 hypothetical protein CQZ93_19525 [Ochrobactrum vermis]
MTSSNLATVNSRQLIEAFDALTASRHLLAGASIIADTLVNDPAADATTAVLNEGMIKLEESIRKFDVVLKEMANDKQK